MPPAEQPQRQKRLDRGQVPPPALLGQGEPFDGYFVLTEWRSPEALLPWQALRDALLWVRRPVTGGPLFHSTAAHRRVFELSSTTVPDLLRAPLTVLSRVLDSNPKVTREELARACRAISRWAEEKSLPQTAISFAQGAARIHTAHAEHAYHVGLLCRRAAEYERAETWYRRALRLATKSRDHAIVGLSWLGLGNLFIQRGNYHAAKLAQLRAFRTARRFGLWNIKGMALHDLFTVAVDQGQVTEAESLARQAFRAYPVNADRLPALASDVASYWMQQGFYERSLVVFRAVLPTLSLESERLLIVSVIARAAAGAGDLALFMWAWTEAWAILDREPTTDRACTALYNLAYASACLEDWERAHMAACRSAELAEARSEREVHDRSVQLLEAVKHKDFEHSLRPRPEDPEAFIAAETLSQRLARRLAARSNETTRAASPL